MTSSCKLLIFIALSLLMQRTLYSQKLPIGYIEQYSEKCTSESFFKTFLPEDNSYWKFVSGEETKILTITTNDSLAKFKFPVTRGIIQNLMFGDYIIEFEFKASQKATGKGGFCFLGPLKSETTYYAFLFTSDTVSFSFVNNRRPILIEKKHAYIKSGNWNKVRIERYILNRSTTIVMNGDYDNKLFFTDLNLVMGYLGFGSQGTTCSLRNIKIWAPANIEQLFFWH
jgi:hypothetical protein